MSNEHESEQSQSYYVRVRGRVLGPFTIDRLRALRDRGQFSRVHQISTDRKNWQPASSLQEVFAPKSSAPPSEPAEPVEEPRETFALQTTPAHEPTPTAAVEAPEWFYCVGDQQHGPVTGGELKSLITDGVVGQHDLVWKNGMSEWMTVGQVSALAAHAGGSTAQPAAGPGPAASGQVFCFACGSAIDSRAEVCPRCGVRQHTARGGADRNRTTAALLAFFLGGVGAHRFYLGNVGLGLVYVLFFWTFIPAVVAFIEFIMFLAMTDEAFAAKYNTR